MAGSYSILCAVTCDSVPIKKLMMNVLIFFLQYCVSKLTVLELLLKIARHVSDEIILKRLLPYMLFLIN